MKNENMPKLLEKIELVVYADNVPLRQNIDLSRDVGKRLAKTLGANIDVVEMGTLLMDCALGHAIKENRQGEHVQMSLEKANELLVESDLSEEEKENIRRCILEHHGVSRFSSLESEIVCNADCYRFVSIKGFCFAMRYLRDMPFDELVSLLKRKVDEKWNALSLDIAKKEITSQYQTIVQILKGL